MTDVPRHAPLDLDRFSEGLRRRLYDRVVQLQFSPADSGLAYTPDEAWLQIVCCWGRWFAVWTDPEEPPVVPARLRAHIVRIEVSQEDAADIELYAV